MGPAGWRRPVKNMEVMLYPLKFKPILKSQIWGGDRLVKAGKRLPAKLSAAAGSIGESWEISGVEGDVSVVSNGFLKSNNLEEITEVYMGDLVGEKVYDTYGLEFPVLVKFIDAHDVLSVQVHPDDGLARERHGSRGKTEMWYVADCEPGAYLYVGFNRPVTRDEYLRAVSEGTLTDLLMRYEVRKGDAYYIPAGTVHAIGPGLLIAEIQETSDITYRISDWGRLGRDGKPRQLHTAEATDAIDFNYGKEYFRPAETGGIKIASIGFFISPDDALIWRGPMATTALKQLLHQTLWEGLDYLLIDLPPGTGDVHLSVVGEVKVNGAIVVSTPQQVAVADVRRGVNMFRAEGIDVPVLGIIENMAWFTPAELPNNRYYLFGKGGARNMARTEGIDFLGDIPIVQSVMEGGENGTPAVSIHPEVKKYYREIADKIVEKLEKTDR